MSLTILRSYAQKSNPKSLPASVLLTHTATSLTIFDAFPKSIFHFLILPRILPPLTVFDLANLKTLLNCERECVKAVLTGLREDANCLKNMVEDEMVKRYGFKWGIQMGFHPVPSMEHLHLHVMSTDFCAAGLKSKKHYNSFHPKFGFFLHLDEVLSWFDAEPSYFSTMASLRKAQYEPLLKGDLACCHCHDQGMKNMPTLKAHLKEEWEKAGKREKAKLEKKRKWEEQQPSVDDEHAVKKRATVVDETKKSESP